MFCSWFLAQAAAEDREAHERSSAGSGKPADRRIDIQPAEDEEGNSWTNTFASVCHHGWKYKVHLA